MQLAVTFRHMDATDAIKTYAHEKVERIILRVTDELEGLVREPKPEVFARSYRGDKIIYKVKVYVNNSTRLEYTRSDLITHIQDALRSAEGSPLDKGDSSHSSQGMQ